MFFFACFSEKFLLKWQDMVILKEGEKTACHPLTPPIDDRRPDNKGRIQTPIMRPPASGPLAFGRSAVNPVSPDFVPRFAISSSITGNAFIGRDDPGGESL
jgi:hypothetical protein